MSRDALGDRMKAYYENITRIFLPRRNYTIIRVDGKAFHTYTRSMRRPFDDGLISKMDNTAKYLCKNMMGAKFAFVQSDEISILLTDFDTIKTSAWFDNNLQKMSSISASMATAAFNKAVFLSSDTVSLHSKWAEFDSRVFQIPSKIEVANYFIWRQNDATRNSIASVAQSLYSHKELLNKNTSEQQEMIFQKGINWNDFPASLKRGRLIVKDELVGNRTDWVVKEPPIFSKQQDFLYNLIPSNEA